MQKLNSDLIAAQKDLQETEYDKYISDQEKLLDQFYNDLEEWINSRLDDLDGLLEDAIAATNENGKLIDDTLRETAGDVDYTLTDEFAGIWDKFSESNGANYDILSLTSDTTSDMRAKMEDLATEAGLEDFFTGEDLALLNEITSVDGNISAMNEAIATTTDAVNSVASNVVEMNSNLGNDILNGTNDIVNAINNKDLSVIVNVDGSSGRSSSENPGSNQTPEYEDTPETPPPAAEEVWTIRAKDGSGKTYGGRYLSYQAAQKALNEAASEIYDKQGYDAYMDFKNKWIIQRYRKGGLIDDKDNPLDIIAQSLGEDHMVAAKEGERILTPEQNKSFEKMVNANFTPLSDEELKKYSILSNIKDFDILSEGFNNLSKITAPDVNNTMSNIGNTTVGDINISLPNVTNKEEFVTWLKNDRQIERVIQSISTSKMLGKNSYDKMKY